MTTRPSPRPWRLRHFPALAVAVALLTASSALAGPTALPAPRGAAAAAGPPAPAGICRSPRPLSAPPLALTDRCAVITSTTVPTPSGSASDGLPCAQEAGAPGANLCPTWATLHDGSAHSGDWGSAVAIDRYGSRLFSAGYSYTSSSTAAGLLVARDATTGRELWAVERSGTKDLPIVVFASVQSSADGKQVFVVGSAYSSSQCQPVVAAYDGTTGHLRWDASLPVGAAPCEYYADSALSADGRRFVITSNVPSTATYHGQHVTQGVLAAFDTARGRRLWSSRTALTGYGYKNWRLALARDGSKAFVLGERLDATSPTTTTTVAWTVAAYAASNGKRLWSTGYDCRRDYGSAVVSSGGGGSSPYCSDPSAVTPVGNRVVITGSNVFGYGVTQVVAFDARSGRQLWHKDRDPLQSFVYLSRALAATSDGSAVFAGRVRIDPQLANPPMFVVERLDAATGSVTWTQAIKANADSSAYCGGCGPLVGADHSGHVYVVGSYPLGDMVLTGAILDARTGAVSRSGLYAWSLAGLETELPQGIAVPLSGSVVGVAGVSQTASAQCSGVTCFDEAALAYPFGSQSSSTVRERGAGRRQ
jgi:outer membrane protein assembly factor BamB